MKNTTSIRNLFMIAVALVFVIAAVVTGILTFFFNDFLVALCFMAVAVIITECVILIYAGKQEKLKELVFNYPIYILTAVYYIAALSAAVWYGLAPFSFKTFFLSEFILLAVFVLYFIFVLVHINNAKGTIGNVEKKNEFIRKQATQITVMAETCSDRELKIALEKLADEFKYSKPVYSESLVSLEYEIGAECLKLGSLIVEGALEGASKQVDYITKLLVKRNLLAANI